LHNNLILIQYWHSQVHRSSPMSAPDLRRKQGCWCRYRRRGVERNLCTQWNQSSDRMQLLLSPTQEENSSETSWICCGSNFTSNGEQPFMEFVCDGESLSGLGTRLPPHVRARAIVRRILSMVKGWSSSILSTVTMWARSVWTMETSTFQGRDLRSPKEFRWSNRLLHKRTEFLSWEGIMQALLPRVTHGKDLSKTCHQSLMGRNYASPNSNV